jgi:predicted nucleotidyltransferase component of viral defense system
MRIEEIQKLSTKYQTIPLMIAREYCQHNILSSFFNQKNSKNLLFKGGTALRIIYRSPRFSEDLDFTGIKGIDYYEIENILINTLKNLSDWGFSVKIDEAKKTSGGYLAKIKFSFYEFKFVIKMEISFRQLGGEIQKTTTSVSNDYIHTYDIIHLSQEEIINGKISALLSRSKPRDWYDIYFFLNNKMLNLEQKKLLPKISTKLKETKMDFKKELKEFLPRSHQMIIKNFKNILLAEIEKNI